MKKLTMQTPNLTDKNIERIIALFPQVATEILNEKDGHTNPKTKCAKCKAGDSENHCISAVDFEKLRVLLGDNIREVDEECYDFTWVGKKQAILEGNMPIRKTLRPCKEESKNWETTENLYIEGDNLDVLKLLQESYLNKVKMIYIDPPYNTGNDFVYKDDFAMSREDYEDQIGLYDDNDNRLFRNTESNGRFHSDWCSMLYPRLKLAHNLLTEDGVIFISIDDNEVHNLRKICDEVFGAGNFVASLAWEKKKKGAFLSKHYINMKEYVLVYSKDHIVFQGLVGEINKAYETYPCIKTTNARGTRIIRKGTVSKYKKSTFSISSGTRISSGNMELIYLDDAKIKDNTLQNDVAIDSNWIYSQSALDEYSSAGLLYITQDLYIRRIVNDGRTKMLKDILFRVGNDGKSFSSFVYDDNLNNGGWGTNEDANDELHKLLGHQYLFDFSKPSRLVAKLIQSANDKDAIILDFFSGSATTAHAVMKLNAEDGGNRKFIMVQLPEKCDEKSEAYKAGYKTIAEIGKERIRRAGEQIRKEIEENAQQLKMGEDPKQAPDIGFRVLKVDSTNMKDVYYSADQYSQQMLDDMISNIKGDRTDLDLLYQVLLDWGLPLNLKHETEVIEGVSVHTVDGDALMACFDADVPESVVREMAKRKPLRVVFRDSSFADSPSKINVEEIFKLNAPGTDVRVI